MRRGTPTPPGCWPDPAVWRGRAPGGHTGRRPAPGPACRLPVPPPVPVRRRGPLRLRTRRSCAGRRTARASRRRARAARIDSRRERREPARGRGSHQVVLGRALLAAQRWSRRQRRQLHRRAGQTSPWSASPAPASRPSAGWCCASSSPTRAASRSTAPTCSRLGAGELRLRQRMQMIFQDPYSSLDPRVPSATRSPSRCSCTSSSIASAAAAAELLDGSASRGRRAGPVPGRAVRRPAAARRHRPRADPRTRADRVRRAGGRARRLGAGAGAQPAARPAGGTAASRTCSSPTTWRSSR